MSLTPAQMPALSDGMDWSRLPRVTLCSILILAAERDDNL
jgi:hypothetical protein